MQVYFAFTTTPERLTVNVPKMMTIMRNQTQQPDKVILSLPAKFDRFSSDIVIPESLLQDPLLDIYTPPKDYGPLTKLWGAMQYLEGKPALLIIGDDDIPYRNDMIEKFVKALSRDPKKVYAGFIETRPYDGLYVAQGCSGIGFYTPAISDVLTYDEIPECFRTDDVWISAYLKNKGIPVVNLEPGNNSYQVTRIPGDYQKLLLETGLTDRGGLFYDKDAGYERNKKCYRCFQERYGQNRTSIPFMLFFILTVVMIVIVIITVYINRRPLIRLLRITPGNISKN